MSRGEVSKQNTAILRALDMIAPQYLAAGAVNPIAGWKKAMQYAPIAQWKDWGYFDINTGRQMKDVLFGSDSPLDRAKNLSMWGAGKMDSLAWGQLWNAVEAETKAKRKDLTPDTELFNETVAARFTEIIDHPQVVDGILQRPPIMRSADGVAKMATSFKYNINAHLVPGVDYPANTRNARRDALIDLLQGMGLSANVYNVLYRTEYKS